MCEWESAISVEDLRRSRGEVYGLLFVDLDYFQRSNQQG